jgi:CubicO group peptidase (beta-lactamase class C family)
MDATAPPAFEAAGGGLLSTLPDYARFCALLLGGGQWNGVELLSPKLFRYMVQNHLPADCSRAHFLLSPGYGFGLGFAVREQEGIASAPGTVGEFNWGGAAGTAFWVAPADELFAILMVQTADHSDTIRPLFRNLVYAALR